MLGRTIDSVLEVACENSIASVESTEETKISMKMYWLADMIRRKNWLKNSVVDMCLWTK